MLLHNWWDTNVWTFVLDTLKLCCKINQISHEKAGLKLPTVRPKLTIFLTFCSFIVACSSGVPSETIWSANSRTRIEFNYNWLTSFLQRSAKDKLCQKPNYRQDCFMASPHKNRIFYLKLVVKLQLSDHSVVKVLQFLTIPNVLLNLVKSQSWQIWMTGLSYLSITYC